MPIRPLARAALVLLGLLVLGCATADPVVRLFLPLTPDAQTLWVHVGVGGVEASFPYRQRRHEP